MNSAKIIQKQFEEEFSLLKEYRYAVDKVYSILDRCKYNEDSIKNIAGLYFNVEKITIIQNDLLVSIAIFQINCYYLIIIPNYIVFLAPTR